MWSSAKPRHCRGHAHTVNATYVAGSSASSSGVLSSTTSKASSVDAAKPGPPAVTLLVPAEQMLEPCSRVDAFSDALSIPLLLLAMAVRDNISRARKSRMLCDALYGNGTAISLNKTIKETPMMSTPGNSDNTSCGRSCAVAAWKPSTSSREGNPKVSSTTAGMQTNSFTYA
eukprot:CAMPEP_0178446520 /NCGR_PEP_ID=MMETSP0689_2-20121128/40857_1 /TAXON_ID=160604 /ORGANISM="Amphidinium massartii, Strain CS-259" /LENGTH=171 /DNA_ID=CAMNT_0020071369 /DNA_START=77 /DNA_END=592 /DNA_ORIENTATION=-